MKVKIEFTLDVDVEAWDANYFTGTVPADVREDVRTYVFHGVMEQLRELGVLAERAQRG